MSELLPLIEDLVRIDSVNPVLDPNRPGEGAIARFVLEWAHARGLETQWLESVPGRPSVIVRARGSGGGRTLMLNAHLDTVGVTGMEAPFEPRVEDGRLIGRGVMDMKASLAVCLLATERAARMDLRGDVVVTAVADEEHGSIGTEEVLRALAAGAATNREGSGGEPFPHAAIVTEPSDLELHVAHRGFSVFAVEFTGKASHTSQPQAGVNAISHLGRLLALVEEHDARLRAREPHPLLQHGSLLPVLAEGGQELFTTPARASATIERRTLPGESAQAARDELAGLLARLKETDPAVQTSVRALVEREPFEAGSGAVEIMEHLSRASQELRGIAPRRLGAPYWTDAALVAAAGIPTVLFGPAGGGIHQPGEWLDVASAETMLAVLGRTVASFCA